MTEDDIKIGTAYRFKVGKHWELVRIIQRFMVRGGKVQFEAKNEETGEKVFIGSARNLRSAQGGARKGSGRRPTDSLMLCGWGCGEKLTRYTAKNHWMVCPRKPKDAA